MLLPVHYSIHHSLEPRYMSHTHTTPQAASTPPVPLQVIDSFGSSSLPGGDAACCAAGNAAHWASEGLHTLAQLPSGSKCAAASHAAHLPCDLHNLLVSADPAG